MTPQEFYGAAYAQLCAAEQQLTELIGRCPIARDSGAGEGAVLYCSSRIKTPESMMGKLKKNGLPPTGRAAMEHMHDAVGVRAVCAFTDDVYRVAAWLAAQPELRRETVKDYIASPKPNGYRSYHLIVYLTAGPGAGVRAEIQLRTIAADFWAALEHQMKYKHTVHHERLIRDELKRCADEIASVDLSMQTIRELLAQDF